MHESQHLKLFRFKSNVQGQSRKNKNTVSVCKRWRTAVAQRALLCAFIARTHQACMWERGETDVAAVRGSEVMFPELRLCQPMFPPSTASYFSGPTSGRKGGLGLLLTAENFPMPLRAAFEAEEKEPERAESLRNPRLQDVYRPYNFDDKHLKKLSL